MSPQTRGYKTICDETRIIKFFTNRCVSSVLYSQIVTILHGYSQIKLHRGFEPFNLLSI